MGSKKTLWIVVGAIAVIILGWNLFRPAGGGISNVDAAGAEQAISQGARIVDVRSLGEFQLGHIPGAINVPIDQFEAQVTSWDRDTPYLVYCATGQRSETAVRIMTDLGFANVRHFNAGLIAWPGELQKGDATPVGDVETSGLPVMIEFYTDS